MYEKKFKALAPQALTADGTSIGSLTIADPSLVKVKQKIRLSATALPDLDLEIKRVEEDGTIFVGEVGKPIDQRTDISAYTTALSASISWPEDQKRPNITADEFERAVYEEEPTVAKRVVLVNKLGRKIDDDNPLPVNATVSIGDVQVDIDFDPNNPDAPSSSNTGAYLRDKEGNLITSTQDGTKQRLDVDIGGAIVNVDVDGFSPTNPDSVLVVGSEDGSKTGVKHAARVDSELDLRVGISDGTNKAAVSVSGELSVSDASTHAGLTAIDSKLASIDSGIPASLGQQTMAASMPVVLASDQSPISVVASLPDEPIKISGTENGQANGTEFTFVNNLRLQILASKDRTETYTYADFGTKDERITRIEYTSVTFPGSTVRRDFNYTIVGSKYRKDSSVWSIV